MSLFERLQQAFAPKPVVLPTPADNAETAAVLEELSKVVDPELGIDLVSLGLVRKISRKERILSVDLTATTSACPLGPYLLDQCRSRLSERFPGDEIELQLVWEPPWSPEQMSPQARQQLGW